MYFFNLGANFIEDCSSLHTHFDSFMYSNQDAMVKKQICIGILFLSHKFYAGFRNSYFEALR